MWIPTRFPSAFSEVIFHTVATLSYQNLILQSVKMAKDLMTCKNTCNILLSAKKQTLKQYDHYDPIYSFLKCVHMTPKMK